nr:putative reverse transcriptase domain-containing protein [Tanacetum cinerariifolium]
MEKIMLIKQRIQAAQDRKKSYTDLKRKPMEFEVGDMVMLKVSPWKGVVRFGKQGKLNPRYVGPFKVLAKVGKVAYRLELPQELSRFVEEPVEIMEWEIKRLKQIRIPLVKVRWNSRRGPEFTWEHEDSFRKKYPHLFTNRVTSSTTRLVPSCCVIFDLEPLSLSFDFAFSFDIFKSFHRLSLMSFPSSDLTLLPQIRAEIREEFRTSSGPSDAGGNPTPVTIHTWLERFNKQKPHSFEKATAPVDAENWISHMEKIFDVMGCEDAFNTRLAVYKFEGNAL